MVSGSGRIPTRRKAVDAPHLGVILILASVAQACGTPAPSPLASAVGSQPAPATSTRTPFLPQIATATIAPPTDTPTIALTPTLSPEEWRDFPVVPIVSDRAREVYEFGLSLGNNPSAFSVIGDCEGTPNRFLGTFDYSTTYYRLGDHTYLQAVINQFAGSFGRISYAAHSGFTTSAVLSQFWANLTYCLPGETPLICEVRIHRPSIAFVMVGTMDYLQADVFESNMRRIIEYLIANGVVPILSTKASNLEGDWSINAATTRLAYEYEVPLWNFWRAVQPLPGHGLRSDGMHVTWGYNFFDDPTSMRYGWPWRNLTALQALEAVWGAVAGPPPDGA